MSLGNAIKYNRENGEFEWSEGYRVEDLTKEHQEIIWWLRHLVDELDGFKADYEIETEYTTTLDKIKNEIAKETIEKAKEWLDSSVDEIQVSLADGEGEE